MVYGFTLILSDTHGIIDDASGDALDEMANAIYEAGGDDSVCGISCGIISVGFDREGENLRDAVLSAICVVHSAGYKVERVEPDEQHVFDEINKELARGEAVTV